MDKYIVIAGNIGAGKSTLVEKLCERTGWKPYFEPVSENPYLEDFYEDMERWAYHSQTFFLADRMAMHKQLTGDMRESSTTVVQDRSIYEDAEIFARNLYLEGKMKERDFQTYWKLYSISISMLNPPDLIIYLKASVETLKRRIAQRNRAFEKTIPREYLSHLNTLYDNFIELFPLAPVLVLDGDKSDIIAFPEELNIIIRQIEDHLNHGQKKLF